MKGCWIFSWFNYRLHLCIYYFLPIYILYFETGENRKHSHAFNFFNIRPNIFSIHLPLCSHCYVRIFNKKEDIFIIYQVLSWTYAAKYFDQDSLQISISRLRYRKHNYITDIIELAWGLISILRKTEQIKQFYLNRFSEF